MEMKATLVLLILLPAAILNVIVHISMAANQPLYHEIFRCKNDSGTLKPNSPYKTNLMSALKKLANGSASIRIGDGPNEVAGAALCAGYLKPKDCDSCVNTTIPLLLQKCPNQKGAVAWRVTCMVRFAPSVGNNYDLWFVDHEFSDYKAKDVKGLGEVLSLMVNRLAKKLYDSDYPDKPLGYAYGNNIYGSPTETVHMVMQCTRDTLRDDCNKCVFHISGELKRCCSGTMAAAVLSPNCYIRYAHADFRIL